MLVVNTIPLIFTDAAPAVSQTRMDVAPEATVEGVAVNDWIFTEVITVSVVLAVTVPLAFVAVIV